MPIVTEPELQAWLEETKLDVPSVDEQLDATARDEVFGALSNVYDVTGWVDTATTPSLVRRIMAMLIAAYLYRRQYSEDSDENPGYAVWLEGKAMALLAGVMDGSIDLTDVDVDPSTTALPTFWPNDLANIVGTEEYSPAVFRMGQVF